MSEKLPVSVHILTWNSGKTLRRAIESVRTCAEILVIDGGSSDDTLRIAQEYGAKIIPQRDREQGTPLQNFAGARNRGLQHATQPWIFSLDSDEIVSQQLMENIRQILREGIPCACFIPRRYVLPDGREVTHATTYPNERMYFFHKDTVVDWEKRVHERPKLKPGIPVKHFQGCTLAPLGTPQEYWEKNMRYLALEKLKSSYNGWGHWFIHRLRHTCRSRCIAGLKLLWIWCLPHRNCVRLPMQHELLRFWYAGKLIWLTCPLSRFRQRGTPPGP